MRKLLVALFISLTFLLSDFNITLAYEKEIKSLSSTMAENIAKAGKKSIAVVDFTDLQGNVTELGRFIAEEFSVALAGAGKGFEVVDRTHLKTILKEHKLATTGVIDPATAKKLGQIAGVDALVTGTITPFGDSVRLSVKILDTATAKVIGASSGDIPKTKAIEELLGKGIEGALSSEQAPTPTTSKSEPKAERRIEAEGFIFEARECKIIAGQIVECHITVINMGKNERMLSIGAGSWMTSCENASFMYDDSGRQYEATNVRFGAKDSWSAVRQDLPPQLPIIAVLRFEDVSPTAQFMTLRIGCNVYVGKQCIEFFPLLRKIPLTR